MGEVASLSRTLEHELLALLRGASLECLVCGEFVLYEDDAIVCPECDSRLERRVAREEVQLNLQTGA